MYVIAQVATGSALLLGVLIAQTDPRSSADVWGPYVGNGINLVFSALVAWYLLTKAIPNSEKRYTDSIDGQVGKYTSSIEKLEDKFSECLTSQRQDHLADRERFENSFKSEINLYRQWFEAREARLDQKWDATLKVVVDHCEKETARRDEAYKTQMDSINHTLVDVREVLEVLRDTIDTLTKRIETVEGSKK